ncbi:type II toxin-antitoxin system HicB family antitoxin [Phormidesmis sp. 146-12]
MSPIVQPSNSGSPLKLTLVLEQLASGDVVASVLEFPQCRVEAETREVAIAQIRSDLAAMLERLEFLPLEISKVAAAPSKSPWIKYAGIFQNDPDFAAIAAAIRAERNSEDDTEVDPAVYALDS